MLPRYLLNSNEGKIPSFCPSPHKTCKKKHQALYAVASLLYHYCLSHLQLRPFASILFQKRFDPKNSSELWKFPSRQHQQQKDARWTGTKVILRKCIYRLVIYIYRMFQDVLPPKQALFCEPFFYPPGDISFWFDRVCVDQQNLWVKVQTLQAVPAFVAQSTDLLVLWDHTWLGGVCMEFM